MSRYVTHPHGLVLGSDNTFFVIDKAEGRNGEPELVLPEKVESFRDGYRAIVSFERYTFDQVSTANVFLRTPAQQLVWVPQKLTWEREYAPEGRPPLMLPESLHYNVLARNWEHWLTENVGAKYDRWDTYTRASRSDNCLFFKRRGDALEFVRAVGEVLAGIKIGRD